ncbi:MAG: Dabb family protein [Algoriphagus sp.]|uniref:Dabb family protein n=1 Tax=Algoriphagus sp. TaxID=1872435 RepID=UPI0017E9593F|nr:Dabb family protein [Algoriphagus sp.]NVJ84746.1 Dabb family protein [Algoriphagus sp.]
MKKALFIFVVLGLFSCQNQQTETIREMETSVTNETKPDSVLRHVVYFSFQEASSKEDIQQVIDAFRNLQNEIPEIKSFEWGVNSSPEGINKGLTHAFTLTFHSEEDRNTYLPHPAHKAFGEILGPHLKDVCVIDYWTRH